MRVVWSESLTNAKNEHGLGKKTIFIGKDSVIRHDTQKLKVSISPVAQLTDVNGSVNQRGVFVVRRGNSAASIIDIEGYRVLWGPDKCDEKSAAPKSKLKDLEIETAGDRPNCDHTLLATFEQPGHPSLEAIRCSSHEYNGAFQRQRSTPERDQGLRQCPLAHCETEH